DVSLPELVDAQPADGAAALGVCVGRPLRSVQVAVAALDGLGRPGDDLTDKPGVTGEICVRAAHVKERYDGLWLTETESRLPSGWHRTGDVGHLDDDGRLWVEGRLGHVVTSPDGPVTPVGVEQRAETVEGVARAA